MNQSVPLKVIEVINPPDRPPLLRKGLLLANLEDETPIEYCGGILLSQEQGASMVETTDYEPDSAHFDSVLQSGTFCIEVPTETFLSQVITEKLQKASASERATLLAELMHQENIPRVLVVHPVESNDIEESSS
ncbi:MAG: hypothetical protein K0Q50_287 [Vampirovibrio sp.]|jgi:hypothetical protein|nr:hypothetical protein [Vampirovibrio sp.]